MKDISIIGVVGICVYGLLSLYGLGCFLTLRYVAFLGDERIPYETPHEALIKRSVAILAYVFVATLLKLLFFIIFIKSFCEGCISIDSAKYL